MRLKRTLLGTVSAVGMLGAIGAAYAQTADQKNVPGTQALQSIDRNLQKDADQDNAGLKNAQTRIKDNQADRATRVDKADRPQRPDRPERAGRS
jgi:hypothetical protein